jgi:hypothetical protein
MVAEAVVGSHIDLGSYTPCMTWHMMLPTHDRHSTPPINTTHRDSSKSSSLFGRQAPDGAPVTPQICGCQHRHCSRTCTNVITSRMAYTISKARSSFAHVQQRISLTLSILLRQ